MAITASKKNNKHILKVRVATEYIYAASISGFLLIPILVGVVASTLKTILETTLNIYIDAFFSVGSIALFYLVGLQLLFLPLVVVPGVIHGLLFHKLLNERELSITFLSEKPLLQKTLLVGLSTGFIHVIFTVVSVVIYSLSIPGDFQFEHVFGKPIDFMVAFPLTIALLTLGMITWTYFIWKKGAIFFYH